jgi:type III pantothenate kinase
MKKRDRALLAIDIGNSTVRLGLFPDETDPGLLLTRTLASTQNSLEGSLRKELGRLLAEASASVSDNILSHREVGVIISSVVPKINRVVINILKKYYAKPFFVDPKSAGLKFRAPFPEKVGSDRIANAVAGFSITGKPTAIVDFGSATTISVVGKRRTFIGGAIMPGLDMMADMLASRTAKLPDIKIARPDKALGSDTSSAITAGIVLGTAGAVMKIVSSIEEETGLQLCLIITGGRLEIVSPFLERTHLALPDLIFEGLRIIYNSLRDRR